MRLRLASVLRPLGLAAIAACAAAAAAPPKGGREAGGVDFHESFIRSLEAAGPDLARPLDVFSYVVARLPRRITVYPSEGYYYFSFRAAGELVRGNIRFDAGARESGRVSFAYFHDSEADDAARNARLPDGIDIGAAEGLTLRKLAPFRYRLGWRGRDVAVSIYDAESERARPPRLYADEELLGPSYDESGVRFWLIFNRRDKGFHYLLNAGLGHVEKYREIGFDGPGARILRGTVTGFAYLHDIDGRMYLIGVDRRSVAANSYYDGPFDQLPDSFVDPLRLRDLIVESDPDAAGKLGPYGRYLADRDTRYAIAPYLEYSATGQLRPYRACTAEGPDRAPVLTCMARIVRR